MVFLYPQPAAQGESNLITQVLNLYDTLQSKSWNIFFQFFY